MKSEVKNKLIDTVKCEWIDDIKQMNNVDDISNQTQHYLEILKHLEELYSKNDKEVENGVSNQRDHLEINGDTDNLEDDNVYILTRKLLGGLGIKNSNSEDTVYVPESVIRSEKLEHGDSFIYEKNGLSIGRDKFNKVEEISKANIESNNIESYDYAVVDFDDTLKSYVCKSYYNDGVLSRLPTFLIHANDVSKYKIEAGDLVTIAHMPNKSIVRIRWKYSVNEPIPTPTPKKASFYKDSTISEENNISDEFSGISIGIVGAEKFSNGYIEEVTKRGGMVNQTNSDVFNIIDNVVNKSDIVVIPVFQTSHAKSLMAKDIAKKKNKPYIILKTNGRTNFINEIRNNIEIIQR
ncbi:DUF2325 domain-containing protein [Staphylococcus aureus]|uniref:DUF2325 domain-containing protein n=1 Tax=Staphylococcus aureus TaxID=1280 RepID=UPI000ABC9C14|nr:DUF2325 domain-containing protein [Staphylococcus aureus]